MAPRRLQGMSDRAIFDFLLANRSKEGAQKALQMVMEVRPAGWHVGMNAEETKQLCCHAWKNSYQRVCNFVYQDASCKNALFQSHLDQLLKDFPDEMALCDLTTKTLKEQYQFFKDRYIHEKFTSRDCLERFQAVSPVEEWYSHFILDPSIYEASKQKTKAKVDQRRGSVLMIKHPHRVYSQAKSCVKAFCEKYDDLLLINSGVNALKALCAEAFWCLCLVTGRRPYELCVLDIDVEEVEGHPYQVRVSRLAKKKDAERNKPLVFPVLVEAHHVIACLRLLRGIVFEGKGRNKVTPQVSKLPAIKIFGDIGLVKYGILRGLYGQFAYITRDQHGWGKTLCQDLFLQKVRGHESTSVRTQDNYDAICLPIATQMNLQ